MDNPDLGNPGGEGNQPGTGTPSGQAGQQPDSRDAELDRIKAENRQLNKLLVEARRGQRQPNQNNQPNGQPGQSPFETPEGQYAISLELATGALGRGLEPIFDLYPELPADEIKRIRMNPWAFSSYESYRTGDWQTALLEIEQQMLERAEAIAAVKGKGQPSNQQPAQINNNPANEQVPEATSGSSEDENPWTMPLDKLELKKNKELAKQAQTKS
jgi:hypothetical protein